MGRYNWNAEDYAQHSTAQLQWARELIDKLRLRGDEAVLDVGCGDGKVTVEFSRRLANGRVVGIDSAAAMIELAVKRYPPGVYHNLRFRQMDARELPFDGQFDTIFSNAALHWVKNHRPVAKGLHRALKPGGRMLLQMGGQGNAATVLEVLHQMQADPQWRTHFNEFEFPYGFPGADEYRDLLTAAGFSIQRLELIPKDMLHPDRAGLAGWFRTTWLPYTERIPENRREAFIEELVKRYLRRVPEDSEGRVHVAMVRLEVAAQKPTG